MRTSLAHQDLQYAICNCKVHRIQLNTASAGGKDVPRPLQSAPPCLTSPEVLGKTAVVDYCGLSHSLPPSTGRLPYLLGGGVIRIRESKVSSTMSFRFCCCNVLTTNALPFV